MKIKSYTFKKNSVLNKDSKLNSNIISNEIKTNNNDLNNVEKILKSPGLNISLSKLDEKGNRLIDINFYNNNNKYSTNSLQNNINNTPIHKINKSESLFGNKSTEKSVNSKINIKLNINSEVINNNILSKPESIEVIKL